jgi:hypothetical protein
MSSVETTTLNVASMDTYTIESELNQLGAQGYSVLYVTTAPNTTGDVYIKLGKKEGVREFKVLYLGSASQTSNLESNLNTYAAQGFKFAAVIPGDRAEDKDQGIIMEKPPATSGVYKVSGGAYGSNPDDALAQGYEVVTTAEGSDTTFVIFYK